MSSTSPFLCFFVVFFFGFNLFFDGIIIKLNLYLDFANFNSNKVLDTLSTFIFRESIHKYKLAVTMEPKSIKCLYSYRLGHLKHKNIMY